MNYTIPRALTLRHIWKSTLLSNTLYTYKVIDYDSDYDYKLKTKATSQFNRNR
jgi:hypothetical protein